MSKFKEKVLKPLASLRLAVVVMAMSMVLIYAGTWAQVDTGIWQVQRQYFHCLFTWIDFQTLLPRPMAGQRPITGGFPFPGGYLLGLILLVNLLAAHITRFKFAPRRIGVISVHLGLILLLAGEGISSVSSRETQMTLQEGVPVNWTQDIREAELAIVSHQSADQDDSVVVNGSRLIGGTDLRDPRLPFDIHVDDYYRNSDLLGPMQPAPARHVPATAGLGVQLKAIEHTVVNGTDAETVDTPSSYLTLSRNGQSLGTYLVSAHIGEQQSVIAGGKEYEIQLRYRRFYKPFSIELLKFTHEKYVGTDTPRNFASLIRFTDATRHEDREVKIWMNHPLYYGGETFYQASFRGDNVSVLQVVRNPAKWLPYAACAIGAFGLALHFGYALIEFLRRTRKAIAHPAITSNRRPAWTAGLFTGGLPALIAPMIVVGAGGLFILSLLLPRENSSSFDFNTFGSLPVNDGRVQPLDSFARNNLRAVSGYESAELDANKVPAIEWLADLLSSSPRTKDYHVIRIDHPDVKTALHLDMGRKLFSYAELLAQAQTLQAQVERADAVDAHQRNDYERKIVELYQRLSVYNHLLDSGKLYLIAPTAAGESWQQWDPAVAGNATSLVASARSWQQLIQDYQSADASAFNRDVNDYSDLLHERLPNLSRRIAFEGTFNTSSPFFWSMFLYVGVFVLACCSWIGFTTPLRRSAFCLLLLTLAFHTFGLVGRVYISGHAPVTNLYSSAVFIAWAGALLCVALELTTRNGIATALAAAIAIPSLIIAYCLAGDGDTMAPLQAVLDTNLWLWTHVICVTLGYAATFVAGGIGILFIVLGFFTPALRAAETRKTLARMTYGILCFAMIFSFVGTILGGIWADQSWGRFWGWDPKENGAVLIVLWTALVLHARWCGWARERGVAALAVFGNIVTSWSWFGTNMLGVGLHSYGFMDRALLWLLAFVGSQMLLVTLGSVPLSWWRSYATSPPPARRRGSTTIDHAYPLPATPA